MFEVLVFLALIPLALLGAWIAIVIGWFLLPYAALFFSVVTGALMLNGPYRTHPWIPVAAAVWSLVWIKRHWSASKRR